MKQVVLFFLMLPFSLSAQITFSPASLNFGDVAYPNKDSIQLTIINDYNVTVSGSFDIQTIYNDSPFSTEPSGITIAANGSTTLWVYFEPVHNIEHTAQLIFQSDYRGDYIAEMRGNGRYMNYYSATFNLDGENLKTALKNTITAGFNPGTYNSARDEMYMVIDNQKVNGQGASVNTLEGVYTGDLATNYNDRSAAQSQGFDTEHTFPQGQFSSNEPMRSDLFHIFPTKQFANSSRGNLPFGNVVSNSSPVGSGGSVKGNNASGTQVFEPRDAQKGTTARAMFYFVVKYQNYNGYLDAAQENELMDWHTTYPPDQVERNRNQDSYAFQNNRNPFIDYPQFADRMNRIGQPAIPLNIYSLYRSNPIDVMSSTDDTTVMAVVENRGNTAFQLQSATVNGSGIFSLRNSFTPITLEPGEGVEIPVAFLPVSQSTANDTLVITTDIASSNLSTIEIYLNGSWGLLSDPGVGIKNEILVYPNPTCEIIFIDNAEAGSTAFLMDLSGSLIKSVRLTSVHETWNVEQIPSGVYLLGIQNIDSNTSWRRIVIR